MPTKSKMLYSFAECKRKFGSPYQIDKAIADGRIWKIGVGVYSDTGEEIRGEAPEGTSVLTCFCRD